MLNKNSSEKFGNRSPLTLSVNGLFFQNSCLQGGCRAFDTLPEFGFGWKSHEIA